MDTFPRTRMTLSVGQLQHEEQIYVAPVYFILDKNGKGFVAINANGTRFITKDKCLGIHCINGKYYVDASHVSDFFPCFGLREALDRDGTYVPIESYAFTPEEVVTQYAAALALEPS